MNIYNSSLNINEIESLYIQELDAGSVYTLQLNTNNAEITNSLNVKCESDFFNNDMKNINNLYANNLYSNNIYSNQYIFSNDIETKNILPITNLNYDIGSAIKKYNNLYSNNLYSTNVNSTNLYGTIQTPIQNYITTIGTLSSLNLDGNIDMNGNDIINLDECKAVKLYGEIQNSYQNKIQYLQNLLNVIVKPTGTIEFDYRDQEDPASFDNYNYLCYNHLR